MDHVACDLTGPEGEAVEAIGRVEPSYGTAHRYSDLARGRLVRIRVAACWTDQNDTMNLAGSILRRRPWFVPLSAGSRPLPPTTGSGPRDAPISCLFDYVEDAVRSRAERRDAGLPEAVLFRSPGRRQVSPVSRRAEGRDGCQ